ncbi:response regulator [Clostridium sp. MCC353]|uniref:response regulator transcription factor n=1 Tax=Clostridium sp. MCC353 TaxID=2592646 RepID=UPI001C00F3D0|nr:response regulator [Clostridium sp. MCC353]MBT9777774.1 response regulator [Clostridium sp. MCC353]
MLSVMIVDDEPLICKGLAAMIPWEKLGLTSAGHAENGEEALVRIGEMKPDIVITDIRMPVMDGLELIEACSGKGHSCHFILLTGYKEFEYAKRAMRYGVKHYILKPTDPELLIKALKEEMEDVAAEQEEAASRENMQKRFEKVATKAVEQYWYECLKFNRFFAAEFSCYVPQEEQNRECVCAAMYIEEKAPYFEQFILKYLTYEILSPLYRVCCVIMGNQLAVIVEHAPDRELLTALKQIKQLFHSYFGKHVMVSVSSAGTYWMVPRMYEKAASALNKNFWSADDEIILPGSRRSNHAPVGGAVDLNRYKTRMAVSTVEVMKDVIAAFLAEIKEGGGTVEEGKQMVLQLYIMAKKYLELNHGEIDIYDVDYILQAKSFRVVEKMFDNLFEDYRAGRKTEVSVKQRTIERMKALIEENLSEEELSLKWIARNHLFMNEEYLGKLFIQYTGMRFSAYVTKIRLAEAKRLLEMEPGIKITELSRRVGFGRNSAYFSTVFKNETGRSPSEYRD